MESNQSEAKLTIAVLSARSSIHTVRWVNGLVARGHKVSLISMHDGGEALDSRVQLFALPHKGLLGILLNGAPLRRLLRKIQPDILHAHYASSYGSLARRAGFQPTVLSVWGSDVYEFPDRSFIHRKLVQINLKSCHVICSTSEAMKTRVTELLPGCESKVSVIPFGVDVEKFRAQPSESCNDEVITVGTVKALEDIYGIDILIRGFVVALRRLESLRLESPPAIRLHIYGKGSRLSSLKELVRSLGADDYIFFRGAIHHSRVPEALGSFDIFVAMSRQESFGVAVIEASACGVPVVVSQVGGLPEVVKNGETGFVVASLDVEALAGRLVELALDKTLRDQMGQKGRTWVKDTYSWQDSLDQMEQVYHRTVRISGD